MVSLFGVETKADKVDRSVRGGGGRWKLHNRDDGGRSPEEVVADIKQSEWVSMPDLGEVLYGVRR